MFNSEHKKGNIRGNIMRIETKRLFLRPYTMDDAKTLLDAKRASMAELRPWMDWAQKDPTLESEQDTIRTFHQWMDNKEQLPLAIFCKETGAFVGSSGFIYKQEEVPSFELGYWRNTAVRGPGFMREAVIGLTNTLFSTHNANRVMLRCHHLNKRSERLALDCGFKYEGELRNARRHVDGKLANDKIFAHIPETWEAFRRVN